MDMELKISMCKECFVWYMCVHLTLLTVSVSGYNNGLTVRNGVHHNPDKLKQLEVERLELGLCHLQEITSFCPFKFTSVNTTMSQRTSLSFPK